MYLYDQTLCSVKTDWTTEKNMLHCLKIQKCHWQNWNFFLHWWPASWCPGPWLEGQVEPWVLPLEYQGGWKLVLEAAGSCCPAQWVLWSSLLLSHNSLNTHETGLRIGQDWVLRRWIIPPGAALVFMSTALLPPLLRSVLWSFLLW